MHFSLMIPTRKRPQKLFLFVESIVATAKSPEHIELRFGIDLDDIVTLDTVSQLQEKYKGICNLNIHTRGRGNSLVNHYLNWLSIYCTGKYILTLNDDSLFRTQDWDVKVYERLNKFLEDKPDGLVCGICKDIGHPTRNGYLATGFPIISKRAVEVLGFFLDPCFMEATADDDICKLYALVNRAVDLRDIFEITHNPVEFDSLDKNYQTLQDKNYVVVMDRPWIPSSVEEFRFFFDERIPKLLKHIERNKNND